jgi:preprotein translocase subunit SecA
MGVPVFGRLARMIFGTRNERMVKRYLRHVDEVNLLEPGIRSLSDAELKAKTDEFRRRLAGGETAAAMLNEILAVAREAMDRGVGIRNIFNPNLTDRNRFEPSKLPAEARRLYDQVQAQIQTMQPMPPEGEFLGAAQPVAPWQYVDIPIALYEAVRELYPESKPPFRARPFDVQIIGGLVLSEGRIAEMKTGEGKTIVGPLACYLAAIEGKQVHVVTVNDYLVQRDRDWTFPFFRALGLRVGAIHPFHMQPPDEKQKAYQCEVVYGTTSEFGFDYLRDNMKLRTEEQVQRKHDFAIVDEVDSILIDEARTPLIISGQAHQYQPRYDLADRLARHLVQKQKEWNAADEKVQTCLVEVSGLEGDIRNARDKANIPTLKARLDEARKRLPSLESARDRFTQFYEVELDKKKASLTHEGISEAQRVAGVGSFYVGDNIDLPHLLEQAIRSHTVYQRDRDYVVAPDTDGEMGVVIVDQNTGRKMVGRQWSDGLHQAVEAKEGERIKEETQTMATITIQNFFKMYKRLAGMTGTADTEATEFHEIYRLDVISIPTNVPVVRKDRNDLVFLTVKDKWESIVDEIKAFHDVGRPVLVGTTSVEKSEIVSQMLSRKYQIKHEVLNAKQHEREAEIIASAGELGAVMIATNMAGRGTDIKLGRFTPEQLLDHWKRRNLAPREVNASMPEAEIVKAVYRHIAPKELGLRKDQVDAMSDEELRLALLRAWCGSTKYAWNLHNDPQTMDESQLMAALDDHGACVMHRLHIFTGIEDLGGLHVVGTERHESRRIDNQLRGRSGRQGDNGSSRFFLSLEDDLMKMFAGKTVLGLLSRLGMKEGDKIEAPMLTRAVEKAQRKVEERNFQIRKNILEYDEPMEYQRRSFYSTRQRVLEGRKIKELIFEKLEASVHDAAADYLDKLHAPSAISEWVQENLGVTIEPERIVGKDREDLHKLIQNDAREEASHMIRTTLGEYLPSESEMDFGAKQASTQEDHDYAGLARWANATFKASLKPDDLRNHSRGEVQKLLEQVADLHISRTDLAPLDQYLNKDFARRELANWAARKFGTEVKPDLIADAESPEQAADVLLRTARALYRQREIAYPIDFAIDLTAAGLAQNPQAAITQFCAWVKSRYEVEWQPHQLPSSDPHALRELLVKEGERWTDERIEQRASKALVAGSSFDALNQWFAANMLFRLGPDDADRVAADPRVFAVEKVTEIMRFELSQFERWVLLQILDTAWKDHLYAMDQIRDAIGFRAFSQKDPRIEFKKEAARQFDEMNQTIRDRVTDLIFKGRLSPQAPSRPAPAPAAAPAPPAAAPAPAPAARRAEPDGAPKAPPPPPMPAQPAIAAAAAMLEGTETQRRDLEAAQRAGVPEGATAAATRTAVAAAPAIGRNEPCPCGSGKKYKQCHGKRE